MNRARLDEIRATVEVALPCYWGWKVTNVNYLALYCQDIAELLDYVGELEARVKTLTETKGFNNLWCPRCGEVFHEKDIHATPQDYYTCPACKAVQHNKCRGPLVKERTNEQAKT